MATKMIRQTVLFSLLAALATTACTTERSLAPNGIRSSVSTPAAQVAPQLPLLYVVDGVRLDRDLVPSIATDQIASVRVIKGQRALREFGPDASYGVVVITTKALTHGS